MKTIEVFYVAKYYEGVELKDVVGGPFYSFKDAQAAALDMNFNEDDPLSEYDIISTINTYED